MKFVHSWYFHKNRARFTRLPGDGRSRERLYYNGVEEVQLWDMLPIRAPPSELPDRLRPLFLRNVARGRFY